MPAAIVSDDAESVVQKEHHLCVPVVSREWPSMVEEERLAVSPILEVNLRAVVYFNRVHLLSPYVLVTAVFLWANENRVKTATAWPNSRDARL
jgi:hypothetical protein